MINVRKYLNEHSAAAIRVGQSGAQVYEIDGKYVLKYMARRQLKDEQFDTYSREALFYQNQSVHQKIYLPEVLEAEASENEILILMKKYGRPERGALNKEMIQKITKTLAALHGDEPPTFMRQDKETDQPLSEKGIEECLSGWKSVLAEHPGAFDESWLEEIAGRINEFIMRRDLEERVLIHGDFHWDNLLEDENGHILFCDWQGVGLGGASGDLAFFLSRLGGAGIQLDAAVLLDAYSDAVLALSGKRIARQDIIWNMNAANVITSFAFWHQYLTGSSKERVWDIYGKMVADFKNCNAG